MQEKQISDTFTPNLCDPTSSFSCLVSSGRLEKSITYVADVLPVRGKCKDNSEAWDWNDSILNRYWLPEDGISRKPLEDGIDGGNHLDTQSRHLTYGEVSPLGVRQLAYEMGIVDCESETSGVHEAKENGESDIVFYDLGSGVGRLVTQMYIDQPNRVAKAVGIELAEERHSIGQIALEGIIIEENYRRENFHSPYKDTAHMIDMSTKATTDSFPIQLIHGDVLDVELDPATTHVYISSLCFPKEILLELQEKLLRLPNIRVVAALNRLDLMHQLVGEQWEERNAFIQMSWGDSMAKIYRKLA